MSALRVASINAHGDVYPVRFMMRRRNRRRPDVVAGQELYQIADRLGDLFPSWRSYVMDGAEDQRRGAKDNPILVRKGLTQLGQQCIKAADASTPDRLAPDRFIYVEAFMHDVGPTAVINIHPHAATMGHARAVDRANETAKFVATLKETIRFWRNAGFHAVVVGDANWKPSAESPDWQDIVEMFRQLGMDWRFRGIDCVAWTKGLRLKRLRVFSRRRVKSDHPGLLADFVRY